jgi:hypothetical protein
MTAFPIAVKLFGSYPTKKLLPILVFLHYHGYMRRTFLQNVISGSVNHVNGQVFRNKK